MLNYFVFGFFYNYFEGNIRGILQRLVQIKKLINQKVEFSFLSLDVKSGKNIVIKIRLNRKFIISLINEQSFQSRFDWC